MSPAHAEAATSDVDIPDERAKPLRRLNLGAALLHFVSGVAVLVLSNGFALPVTGTYLAGPPGTPGEQVTVFDLPMAGAIALFLFLSSLFHLIVSAPRVFERYRAGLAQTHNTFRWVEYSLSSSLMIVIIALLLGISDIAALVAIFGVNASMILFGWLQEKFHQPGDGRWLPFSFGCLAGAVPWVAVLIYVLAPGSTSNASAPGFVYAIIVSLFLLFNVFAVVQVLQYRPVGKFKDYLVGERLYIILSFVAKSALAWQIFAGTLAGGS